MKGLAACGLLQCTSGLAQLRRGFGIATGNRIGCDLHGIADPRLDGAIALLTFEVLSMALLRRRMNGNMRHNHSKLTAPKIRVNMAPSSLCERYAFIGAAIFPGNTAAGFHR